MTSPALIRHLRSLPERVRFFGCYDQTHTFILTYYSGSQHVISIRADREVEGWLRERLESEGLMTPK